MTEALDTAADAPHGAAVTDWACDYDLFDPTYVQEPFAVWSQLRRACPVAHSDRYGGSWLPTRYEDVSAIAHDVEQFSSREVSVVPLPHGDQPVIPLGLPPLQSDPPEHTWARRLLVPWFSPGKVAEYERLTRALCRTTLDRFADAGYADAVLDYAHQIPVRVIASVLGVEPELADTFTSWVRDLLEYTRDPRQRLASRDAIVTYFTDQIAQRRHDPSNDLISYLLHTDIDGEPVPDGHILGTAVLTLIAGIDTTASAISAALWHLASHDHDRARLINQPELLPSAIEELLRAYSPVTMARVATTDVEVHGCPIKTGDRVLVNFPAANRDPNVFPDPDHIVFDRTANRHLAFGTGIHRCAGSHLARMELRVALEEWLTRIPSFHLTDPDAVTWTGGQVRGPRTAPVRFP